jgi:DNA mismatch repair protein MutL
MSITKLSREVASKIAAGEVVERPASVVKELVENSIDAGATDVEVDIRRGGIRHIQVADNGTGIPSQDVELALDRYSTSKLTSAEDLAAIHTLGFRGEALASIASVSQMTVLTRAEGEKAGTFIRLEGGKVVEETKKACPQGTVITVENLFYNTPARRKFLKGDATERKHSASWVTSYALAYPEIRFALTSEGRRSFHSTGQGKLFDVLIQLYGLNDAGKMLEVEASEGTPVRISGYVSVPQLTRANRNYLTFFVNRRWVKDSMLAYSLEEACHGFLPKGRHPIAVIDIQLDPADLDVNVHPAKREIKFSHPKQVFSTLQKAVRSTLQGEAPIPALRPSQPRPRFRGGRKTDLGRWAGWRALEIQRPAEEVEVIRMPIAEEGKLPPLRPLGQIAASYIVAEGPDGLYIIDQHAAHERIRYDELMAQDEEIASQALLTPLTLDLTPEEQAAFEESSASLSQLGFEVAPFGGRTYVVRAIPAVLVEGNVEEALRELLDEVLPGKTEKDWRRKALATVACHGAVKAGQSLSGEELRGLIKKLEETDQPRTCPHGRPTVICLSTSQLEKRFLRR